MNYLFRFALIAWLLIAVKLLGQLPAGGGGSGSSSVTATTGVFASLPATVNGIYGCTDCPYVWIGSGAAGQAYFGSNPVTLPPSAGWSWDNQASSTVSVANGMLCLSTPKSGTISLTLYYRTAPATPYTVKIAMLFDHGGAPPGSTGTKTNSGFGIAFRDSAAKLVDLRYFHDGSGPALAVTKWTNTTTFSASYLLYQGSNTMYLTASRQLQWLSITDNGTNLIFQWSIDGENWKTFDTRSRTDFMASGPNAYGIVHYANGNAVETCVVHLSVQ